MKCYIINLDRAPERMQRMSDLMRSHTIDFVRCSAVDGKNFTEDEILYYRSRRNQGKPLTVGEIACSESHMLAYMQILEGADEYAVVMEDDLHLSEDVGDFINCTEWIPEGAELIKIETVDEPTLLSAHLIDAKNNRKLGRLSYKHWGSGAYVISISAAKRMLDEYSPGSTPIDDYLFDPSVTSFSGVVTLSFFSRKGQGLSIFRRDRPQFSMHRKLRGDGIELFVRLAGGTELKSNCG
ncbi:glycosyltransferase family 25 protein [Brucella pseudogrignonensis]|uniref:glycosyltransferase family 25 protein n=1 Tax=Brucella pseudogrignonensis TaxID=419475 RepID=UPI003D969F98